MRLLAVQFILVSAAQASVAAAAPARQPNIILIMVDDLGPEWISCYGADDIKTPAIDRLAAGGMRFTAAYSMPKCTPTRATLLTGQYPFRHGWVNHWDVPRWGAGCHFDPKHNLTFARLLKQAGYVTAIAGKWQINDFRVQPNVLADHGFDAWCMWTGFETGNPPSGQRYWDPYIHTRAGSKTYRGKFGADVFADFIIEFMSENRDSPMMIYFPMVLTHGPLVTTPAEPKAATGLDKHKAMVRYVDRVVGRLVEATERLKIAEDTILIFTTDNGTGGRITGHLNGRSVRGGKGSTSERGCWEPFIVYGPTRVPKGVVTDCLTDFTDLLPTFCDLAGAEIPSGLKLDGHSIADVILGRAKDGSRQWIMAMGGGVAQLNAEGRVVPAKGYAPRAIRDKRYKLLIDSSGRPGALFDLQEDRGEKNNILSSADAQAVAALKKLLSAAAKFPKRDASPRYDPTPAQPWDTKGRKSKSADDKSGKAKKRREKKNRKQQPEPKQKQKRAA
jgi:arylsulfatase A-like enzyme